MSSDSRDLNAFSQEQGPPDLDKIFSDALRRARKKSIKGSNSTSSGDHELPIQLRWVVLLLLFVWGLSGIYIVSPAERGVELRFGRFSQLTTPGPHWIPPIVASRTIVNVQKIYMFNHTAQMLTRDANIVDVALSVQYRVRSPQLFLFNVRHPIGSLQQATASAVRQVVGHTTLDDILTDGRMLAREQMLEQLTKILDRYQTGIEITDLNLQPIKPPEAVTAAFDDAIKAREDEQRYINKALAYQERIVLTAKGRAKRILQEALAYQKKVVMGAQADIATYLALLPQHQRAPKITDFRLFTAALEQVFSNARKIMLEGDSRAQVMVWPTQQAMSNKQMAATTALSQQLSNLSESDANITSPERQSTLYQQRHSYSEPHALPESDEVQR